MKGSKINEAFTDIAKNLSCLRTTPLYGAIFHEITAHSRIFYSDRVHTMMRSLIESVHKSHEAAGMAIIKLADPLRNCRM